MPAGAEGRRAVAVLVPAFQAAATIADVVARARRALPDAAVYVVDDGSTDGTAAAASAAGARVLPHPRNRGKGAALATGIARALADGAGGVGTLGPGGPQPPARLPQ